jgi:hypothetical protein
MSVPAVPPRSEPPSAGNSGARGCLSVRLALIGVLLLLPGICSLVFMVPFVSGGARDPGPIGGLWLMTFLLAAAGIGLIVAAIRRH